MTKVDACFARVKRLEELVAIVHVCKFPYNV